MITDSGGFQVFSLAHGGVADEIKGRRGRREGAGGGAGDRRGWGAVPLLSRRLRALLGPEDSMADPGGARLRHRARLRRVHAVSTPTATTRRARPSAPTAGSTAASTGTSAHGPRAPGGVRDRPGRGPRGPEAGVGRARSRRPRSTGSRSAARSAATRRRCTGCWTMTLPHASGRGAEAPARDRRGRRPARGDRRAASTSSTARCRPGSRATAWRWHRCRTRASGSTSARSAHARATRSRSSTAARARPARGHTRAYLHYLSRAEELTAACACSPSTTSPTRERLVRRGPRGDRGRALRRLRGRCPRRRGALGRCDGAR